MGTLKELLSLAEKEVGYQEKAGSACLDEKSANAGYGNYTKYARDISAAGLAGCQGQAWCATYQFWLEMQTFGVEEALRHFHMTKKNYEGYRCFGIWDAFEKAGMTAKTPKAGSLVIFRHSHVGRVIRILNGNVVTNEGNTSALYGDRNGGCVREKSYAIGDETILGYCVISYPENGSLTEHNGEWEKSSGSGTSERVAEYQHWLNVWYGLQLDTWCQGKLEEDGSYGPKTRAASLAVWKDLMNRRYACGLTPGNPVFGAQCRTAAKKNIQSKGCSGTFSAIIEGILAGKGLYEGNIDAAYGTGLEQAVKEFQKRRKIKSDGIVGADTWWELFQ